MEITGPKEWHALLDFLEKERGMAILLGATDTGKTTLAKFLIFNLCKRGLKVALVDADIGQSFLGPPTTIGFAVFKSDPNWELVLSPPEIFFVGSITPEGCFSIHLKGIKRMVDKALLSIADVIIVDTTGFILGDAGKELKRRKIDLLSPQFILALQKTDEIESLLELYQENSFYKIIRLPLSDQLKPRTMEERRVYRINKFQDYFKHAVTQELSVENVKIEGEVLDPNGDILPLDWALRINGILIGLKDDNDVTLALGIIRNYVEEKKVVRVLTSLEETQRVKMIQLSSLKVILLYEEERL
jgi:polynucleotide 5'-hydroxyl-kinase GRC3/NOL9